MSSDFPFITDGGLPPSNSFVVAEDKLVYISVTKAACSSLRWMVADLAGEDSTVFFRSTAPHPTRLMTIHSARERWQRTPQLSRMSPDQLSEISRDNGWFIFAVVRDPWSRLWSAWQSKFLVRHTGFVRNFGDEPWFPRIPVEPGDVLEDFRAFVEAHPWTTYPRLEADSHFWPQVRSARPDGLDYTRVYDLSNMAELISDLQGHLAGLGKPSELYLPRANETPLAMTAEVLADGVGDRIEELYAEDFLTFPGRWKREALKLADGWSRDALRSVAMQAAFYERLGDVSDEAARLRRELRETRKQLKRTRTRLRQAKPVAHASTAARVQHQVDRVRRRLGR